ncbi:hypothetical protein GGTG_00797 [Gaeumannomyces tritici R3-111a-1]|uniref:Uncharacterized protein n=1 Tax=Gaeumannomyces tritici (strain R3-111a-1) TaxID=644352 RepID=J3NHR0_GAET3|nr:hypothetical protein GGTG_00797 [Gaeumannomyces tritici R3-111a-1]EJT80803.1 hypothetical protein GGTG_00797 [Gaeumannomyces tritici R3-111a-1]
MQIILSRILKSFASRALIRQMGWLHERTVFRLQIDMGGGQSSPQGLMILAHATSQRCGGADERGPRRQEELAAPWLVLQTNGGNLLLSPANGTDGWSSACSAVRVHHLVRNEKRQKQCFCLFYLA